MTDIQYLRERYLRDDWQRQLGNLASTLARLSSRASDPRFDQMTADLLREGLLFIEWSASHVSADIAVQLAGMQRELYLWWVAWPADATRTVLAFRARAMSDQALKLSGLVPSIA